MTPCSLCVAFIMALAAAAAAAGGGDGDDGGGGRGRGMTSADQLHVQCAADRYYDPTIQQCTPCTDICNPARRTDYLCLQHIDVCNGKPVVNCHVV